MPSPATFSKHRFSVIEAVRELFRYRVLLITLVNRQLKARYRGSVLGFLWTVLNPLLLTGVYALVFRYYIRVETQNYTAFLLCGLLPWTFFSSALTEGTNSILSGGSLITKSMFPPHVLPTVTVLSQVVNYLLSLPVLILLLLVCHLPIPLSVLGFPLILLLQTIFTWGIVIGLAALNVHFRDIQHILANVLMLWFFLCPIIYPASQVPPEMRFTLYLNPVGTMIEAYHEIFLNGQFPSGLVIGNLTGFAVLSVLVGNWIFEHYRDSFPELV